MTKNKSTLNQIIISNEPTVIEEYNIPKQRNSSYQSEKELEDQFVQQLIEQGYEFIELSNINKNNHEDALIQNLRQQISRLNNITFSDNEWNKLFNEFIANKQDDSVMKTYKIQNDEIYSIELDNGHNKNIRLIDKDNVHNNKLQVLRQYINPYGNYENRYDVSILVNGLPLIHIELKRRGVQIKEAFNQIIRYKNDSFGASFGLFNYIQIFVISNGTETKYYSNTTRYIKPSSNENKFIKSKTSNSFEFTTYWSDSKNKLIKDLEDFTKTFFAKHTILNILTKYCIFTEEKKLIVMRPYQIVATEKIIDKIKLTNNYKHLLGKIDAGGYIWHTTGSGKTITSFKTAQLASKLNFIEKVIFVVDRKDLDYQTMKEYDKFAKGSANSNTSTKKLQEQLEDANKKIIITTIQKLSIFIKKNQKHNIFSKHVVLIFDECHRSQFGDMHSTIVKNFKKYNIFGFTGTPIFPKNSSIISSKQIANEMIKQTNKNFITTKTTEQIFGEKLHTYTIVDAINDKNVLKFKYSFVSPIKDQLNENMTDEEIQKIDENKILLSDEWISTVTKYIIDHFNQITYQDKNYTHNRVSNIKEIASNKKNNKAQKYRKDNIKGFNSIFAVSSIEAAKKYYLEFKKQLSQRNDINLNIATIFSFAPNEDVKDYDEFLGEENNESVSQLDKSSREFLDSAIDDYNKTFGTTWSTSNEEFQAYYKDVSMRTKNKEIDILIVVNMFLTGFDAPALNTLWVDKKLHMHGLIQAFSRTNRILNEIKTHGNIISFRPLHKKLNEALSLFSDSKASGIVILRPFSDYYNGYKNEQGFFEEGYIGLVNQLKTKFPIDIDIIGEQNKKDFIKLYGKFLQIRNVLLSYIDEFTEDKIILNEREIQDYNSRYLDTYDEIKREYKKEKADIVDDLVFEIELVKQIDINIDYLFNLVAQKHVENIQNKDLIVTITKIIDSSFELRNKKDLIIDFLNTHLEKDMESDWSSMMNEFTKFKNEKQNEELMKIIDKYRLDKENTFKYIENCMELGYIKDNGTNIDKILPPKLSRFSKENNKIEVKKNVIESLQIFFDKFYNL